MGSTAVPFPSKIQPVTPWPEPDLSTLKACPFCTGVGPDLKTRGWGMFWIECRECDAQGPHENTQRKAIHSWNHRCE